MTHYADDHVYVGLPYGESGELKKHIPDKHNYEKVQDDVSSIPVGYAPGPVREVEDAVSTEKAVPE